MSDRAGFEAWASRARAHYRVGENPALTAKFERLIQDARRAGLDADEGSSSPSQPTPAHAGEEKSRIGSLLSTCEGPADRAERVLALLLEDGKLGTGYLFAMKHDGLSLVAQRGASAPPQGMEEYALTYVRQVAGDSNEVTVTTDGAAETLAEWEWASHHGKRFRPLLLAHETKAGFAVTAVAVLDVSADRGWIPPSMLLASLSSSLLDAGDVATVVFPAS
jgi:hypothetical protein